MSASYVTLSLQQSTLGEKRRVTRTYEPPDVPGYFEQYVWPAYEGHVEKIRGNTSVRLLDGRMSLFCGKSGPHLQERSRSVLL